jgi:hypothetical protein
MAIKNKFKRYEEPSTFWEAPFKTIFSQKQTPQSQEELIQEGIEKDYGKIDKEWSLKDKLGGYYPNQQRRYLETMSDLTEQGPSRGGTSSGQFIMNQMDIAHRKGQADKIKKEKEIKDKIEEEKRKAEEEAALLDSPRGRLQTLWADADKRDAILGGITDAMTEVKFGKDAYQSRFYDTQKKIRQNLKVTEMTKLAKQKAQLDMMKVAAETSALANPAQYMTTSQKDAMAIVTASGLRPGSPEWNQEYARQLQQIVVKDLTSAKASALTPLYTYSQVLLASDDPQDKLTGQTMIKAIESIAGYLSGSGTSGQSRNINEIVVEEKETIKT